MLQLLRDYKILQLSVIKGTVDLAVKGEIDSFPVLFHALYKLLNTCTTFRKLPTVYFKKSSQSARVIIMIVFQLR